MYDVLALFDILVKRWVLNMLTLKEVVSAI
jgi:hypothetical protein